MIEYLKPSGSKVTGTFFPVCLALAFFAGCSKRSETAGKAGTQHGVVTEEIARVQNLNSDELWSAAMMHEIRAGKVIERFGYSNAQDYVNKVWSPFVSKVSEGIQSSPIRFSDPVGALKQGIFDALGPGLAYNKQYNSALDPLDPKHPRGQCRSLTRLACLLIAQGLVNIPEGTTAVVVYADTHMFLGTVRNGMLSTHEFVTRDAVPCNWGALQNIRKPEMRVVKLNDSLRSLLLGVAVAEPLLDTVGRAPSGNFTKPGQLGMGIGSHPSRASDADGQSTIQDKDPYAFESGTVVITPGDRAISASSPRSPAEYQRSSGVYQRHSLQGDSNSRESSDVEITESEAMREALSILTPLEQKDVQLLLRHLPNLQILDAKSAEIYFDKNISREQKVQALRKIFEAGSDPVPSSFLSGTARESPMVSMF